MFVCVCVIVSKFVCVILCFYVHVYVFSMLNPNLPFLCAYILQNRDTYDTCKKGCLVLNAAFKLCLGNCVRPRLEWRAALSWMPAPSFY